MDFSVSVFMRLKIGQRRICRHSLLNSSNRMKSNEYRQDFIDVYRTIGLSLGDLPCRISSESAKRVKSVGRNSFTP